jgi:hypothetical protein
MDDPLVSKPSFEDRALKFKGLHTKAIWLAIGVLAVVVLFKRV